jgi:hypothetical protein
MSRGAAAQNGKILTVALPAVGLLPVLAARAAMLPAMQPAAEFRFIFERNVFIGFRKSFFGG